MLVLNFTYSLNSILQILDTWEIIFWKLKFAKCCHKWQRTMFFYLIRLKEVMSFILPTTTHPLQHCHTAHNISILESRLIFHQIKYGRFVDWWFSHKNEVSKNYNFNYDFLSHISSIPTKSEDKNYFQASTLF